MTDKEKIISEIERLKAEIPYHENAWSVLNKLKDFIKSLSEQPNENLKKESHDSTMKLMDRPSDIILTSTLCHLFMGHEMHDHEFHGGEDTWSFPEGVREKLKDNKRYRVWYTRYDPSDPYDTSSHYCVYYIEELE